MGATNLRVTVVGAGPAGSTAARILAEKGCQVLLLDKSSFPRYKTCGGGLIQRSLQRLPQEVLNFVEHRCHHIELNFLSQNMSFEVGRDEPVVSMVMREPFDNALLQLAISKGCEFSQRCQVKGLKLNDNKVLLETGNGVIESDYVIAADGSFGKTAELAGFSDERLLIPALEAEVQAETQIFEAYQDRARFDFDLVDDGYAWVFPKQSHLSIGVLSMTRGKSGLNEKLVEYLDILGISKETKYEKHGFVIPVRPRLAPFLKNRTLLVGDVLGLADPITAEGISSALISGECAANALIEGNTSTDIVAQKYKRALEKEILNDLKWSKRLAGMVYGYPGLRNWIFRRYGQKLSEKLTNFVMGKTQFKNEMLNLRNYMKLLTRQN